MPIIGGAREHHDGGIVFEGVVPEDVFAGGEWIVRVGHPGLRRGRRGINLGLRLSHQRFGERAQQLPQFRAGLGLLGGVGAEALTSHLEDDIGSLKMRSHWLKTRLLVMIALLRS